MKVLTVLSGGLDSATLLWLLHAQGYEQTALTFHYGQRHALEIEAAQKLTSKLNVPHLLISVPFGYFIETSAITGKVEVPEGHYESENMKQTVVPNRNMVFLSIAAAIALGRNIQIVAYGAHAGDHTIYPDCRQEFVDSLIDTVKIGNWNAENFTVLRPFISKSKGDIVKLGMNLKVPYELTHSCYKNYSPPCGKCGTCVERAEAFKTAGAEDPLIKL